MKRILALLLILSMMLLVACGNADTGTDEPSETDTATEEVNEADTEEDTDADASDNAAAAFTATITGAVEAELSEDGFVQCDPANGGEIIVYANFGSTDNIQISLPQDIQAGTHDLSTTNSEPDNIGAEYVGESFVTQAFDENVTGTLELVAVAGETGQQMAGNFEFTAENGDGESVTVMGNFNIIAVASSFGNC